MNKEFLNQLSPEDQSVSEVMQSQAQSIRVNPQFQSNLEARLKQVHPENKQPERGTGIKILPAIGWAILAIGAFLILNWAVSSLVPDRQPAANGTPDPDSPFETSIDFNNMCTGQLAAAHGFSVSLTNPEKTGFIALDEEKNIGELRSFALSPDGSQLAIVGNTRGNGNLYLTDAAGTQLQPILSNSELGYLMGAAWSHDGSRLLTWEIENNKRLYLLNKDGTGLTRIDLPVRFSETPQFVPDDESILFFGADDSTGGLFRVTIDGLQVELVSNLVEDDSSFAWSPDGSHLAYIEMDRDLGEARLVVESEDNKSAIATFQIPKGSGSSLPNSANLSWSPDGQSLVFELGRNAGDRAIYLAYLDGTEPLKLAESAHAPAISSDGNCLAFIRNQQLFLLDLTTVSPTALPTPLLLADLPAGRGPVYFELDKLGWGESSISAPDAQGKDIPTPAPSGMEYDWRGIKLYLDAPLPDTPVEANLYQINTEQPATVESARAMAQRFGIEGEIYQAPVEASGTTNFLVTDGKQRLYVRSDQYFTYYADYPNYTTDMFSYQQPLEDKAQEYIDKFLKERGFDFAYQVEHTPQIVNSYYVVPLSPDGFPLRFDYLLPVRLEIKLDSSGRVVFAHSSQINYQQIGTFGLRTADEAWQKVLSDTSGVGMQEGMRSGGILEEYYWQRPYPDLQPVTVYGRLIYYPPLEAGGTPFASIGDHTLIGNLAGMDTLEDNSVIEANGSFSTENGMRTFKVDSWKVSEGRETSLMGTLKRDGDQAIMLNYDGIQYPVADVPVDAPFDIQPEQGEVNVSGVLINEQFEWSLIQYIPAGAMGGGGGGGGGGQGFYKLNLSGTPVPLPTQQPPQAPGSGTGGYVVQEGDTLSVIAEAHGTTVDELMQANGLVDTNIFIGQTLLIPNLPPEPSPVGQKIEGQRGILLAENYRQTDGSQQIVYSLLSPHSSQYNYFVLSGDGLEGLEQYHNRPIDIWGTIESVGGKIGMVVHVDRFEIPFPDLQFQILRGTQEQVTLEDQVVTLFTTNGQKYVQFSLEGNLSGFIVGQPGDEILLEALTVPGETFGGYPTVRVYSAAMAINPKNGQPMDMQVTADIPSILEGPVRTEHYYTPPPTATIETIELVYYTPDTRYRTLDPNAGPVYLQPAWRFSGHYSSGGEFEIMVQALQDEFLLPEIEVVEPPG